MGSILSTEPRTAEKAEELLARLRQAPDDRLARLKRVVSAMIFQDEPTVDFDPFSKFGVEIAFADLIVGEINRRQLIIRSTEADLQGGHLVEVGTGDASGTFAATCAPDVYADEGCWTGPDRETIAEALEDGRRHHPTHEPQVWERLR